MLIERLEMALVTARSSIFADRIRLCDLVVVRGATWEVMEGQMLGAEPLLKHLTVGAGSRFSKFFLFALRTIIVNMKRTVLFSDSAIDSKCRLLNEHWLTS